MRSCHHDILTFIEEESSGKKLNHFTSFDYLLSIQSEVFVICLSSTQKFFQKSNSEDVIRSED